MNKGILALLLGGATIIAISLVKSFAHLSGLALSIRLNKSTFSPAEQISMTVSSFNKSTLAPVPNISFSIVLLGLTLRVVNTGPSATITTAVTAPDVRGSYVLEAVAGSVKDSVVFNVA